MRKIRLFIIVLTVALSVLLILFAVSLYLAKTAQNYYQSSWMSQMWSGLNGMDGMMGNGSYGTPSYLWLIPLALIAVAAVGFIGFAFYYAFPEIRVGATKCEVPGETAPTFTRTSPPNVTNKVAGESKDSVDPFDLVSKTMTPEERKVLDVLRAHDGKYLQKYIRNETGLSRLKTHRIIARFAERGIVTLQQSGNTNEVQLCDWVQGSKP
jgi:hypothetical protein